MGTPSTDPAVATDWAKHLRPFGKRTFWKKVRQKSKQEERIRSGKSKKDTKRWCKGKVGREHKFETFPFPIGMKLSPNREFNWLIDVCAVCGKHVNWRRDAKAE